MFAKLAHRVSVVGAAGAVLAISLPAFAASIVYTYDVLGRLETAFYEGDRCVAYAYDANGNRTSRTSSIVGSSAPPTWGAEVFGCFRWATP
ncbi:hypothetical protein ASD52_36400 [Ensifer sp. Root142]|nr:hypothetical protein ASD52_36400 [Ensifer sp. Root142]